MSQKISKLIRRIPGLLKIITIILVISLTYGTIKGQNEIDVIRNNWIEYSDASNSLYHYLSREAYTLLEKRDSEVEAIVSLNSWQQRQRYIRDNLIDIVGQFPERTPLNANIVRTISREGYRIEHIIFESQPGFFVTSSLFIPAGIKRGGKAPSIIYCSGHTVDGYRSEVYQHVILNLVSKGFIVFAFDPVGQGERLEYFDPKSEKSIIGGPTMEHSYPGAQAFITGSSQASYMIWDGIRAVDYLLSREEVDPARIGITGRSGGGTQSAYIAAMDDRIYAAAPENYITKYKRLLQTIGPQDAEQNLFNLILRGLDHPDFLIVRAPKPAMMITTTGDMFSIQGAIETEKEVSGIYKAYGKQENFSRVEDDAGHASTQANREAMYAFFQKHLNNPGNPHDEKIKTLEPKELQVTRTGQVSTSLNSETVFSLNLRIAEDLEDKLNISRVNFDQHIHEVPAAAKLLSGYREPSAIDDPVITGRIKRDNYWIEKYFVKGEGDYVIPYLLLKPDKPDGRVMVYLHPDGKASAIERGEEVERFVDQGITVMAPDLIGTGETGPGILHGDAYIDGISHNLWYASILTGRSITGIQAGDVVKLVRILKRDNEKSEIMGYARKEMAPVLLHAAAFAPEIGSLVLLEPYSSYMSIVRNRYYYSPFITGTVPGAVKGYDLPDLAASIAPRKLFIAGITDGSGSITDTLNINKDIEIIKKAYRYSNANENLIILTGNSIDDKYDILLEWIK